MQTEIVDCRSWATVVELGLTMADYPENFHNPRKYHSSLATLTANEYETTDQSQQQLSRVRTANGGQISLPRKVVVKIGPYKRSDCL